MRGVLDRKVTGSKARVFKSDMRHGTFIGRLVLVTEVTTTLFMGITSEMRERL